MIDALVGLDIGTTATKGVLLAADGTMLATATREATLRSPQPSWAEMEPDEWWSNACAIFRELCAATEGRAKVLAVGISGMVPALVLQGSDGRPLRPSIQQNDARTAEQIEELVTQYGQERFYERTGGSINQQVLAPKLRWLEQHEASVFARAQHLCGAYDYVAQQLTGERHVEHNWALESGLASIDTGRWDDELVALAGIDPTLLPPIHASHDIVGKVSAAAAAATGLPLGTPVIAGVADHVASAFAAGVARPGDLLVKFGGAGDVLYSMDELVTDPRLFIDYHVVPGAFYLNGCMATSGSLLKWFVSRFGAEDSRAAEVEGRSVYAHFDDLATPLPPGADGLVLLPYFLGEKTPLHDPYARGTIVGLGLHHHRQHLYRAILEAVAYGFRHHADVLAERGLPIRRVLASDGGASSDLWLQITADVLGQPVHRVEGHPGSSLGAAFLAGKAIGIFEDWSEIDNFVQVGEPFHPHEPTGVIYDDYYALYRESYQRLRDLYPRLAAARDHAAMNGVGLK